MMKLISAKISTAIIIIISSTPLTILSATHDNENNNDISHQNNPGRREDPRHQHSDSITSFLNTNNDDDKRDNNDNNVCPEGYYCLHGNITTTQRKHQKQKQHPCGRVDFFCPLGSQKPTIVHPGYYTIGGTTTTRHGESICEPGFFCIGGIKQPCPPGHYGATYGLQSPNCTNICQAGYYCPSQSISPTAIACGHPSRYCPEGSSLPRMVDKGYYSANDDASVSEDDDDEYLFPATRSRQLLSPRGHFALNGSLHICPAGRYGAIEGLSDASCSGPCAEGFYCPPASIHPKMVICGGSDRYCPEESASPLLVRPGYYTSMVEEVCGPGLYRGEENDEFSNSNSSSNEMDGTDDDVYGLALYRTIPCIPCPDGTYKYHQGNERSICLPCGNAALSTADRLSCVCRSSLSPIFDMITATCHEHDDTTTATSNIFNHPSSSSTIITHHPPPPWHNGLIFSPDTSLTRITEHPCPIGYYCIGGIKHPCPPGTYGDRAHETNPSCRGPCPAGYWCGPASTNPHAHTCGGTNVYCPRGSIAPRYVTKGYYTNEDVLPNVRSYQTICPMGDYCTNGVRRSCPAGRYGSSTGLTSPSCTGLCLSGYYCPPGSTHPTPYPCGNVSVYCPTGSERPTPVDVGFRTRHDRFEPEWKGRERDPTNSTMSDQVVCERGYYCIKGVRYRCPPGTYGWIVGSSSVKDCRPCRAGYYCPWDCNGDDDGDSDPYKENVDPYPPCTIATAYPCGRMKYCPSSLSSPKWISRGYYGTGGFDNEHHTSQSICEPGFFCIGGVKQPCPPGTYGNESGLVQEFCSGFCPAGYYCPRGSVEPKRCQGGSYTSVGAEWCIRCRDDGGEGEEVKDDDGQQTCRDARSCCGRS